MKEFFIRLGRGCLIVLCIPPAITGFLLFIAWPLFLGAMLGGIDNNDWCGLVEVAWLVLLLAYSLGKDY